MEETLRRVGFFAAIQTFLSDFLSFFLCLVVNFRDDSESSHSDTVAGSYLP